MVFINGLAFVLKRNMRGEYGMSNKCVVTFEPIIPPIARDPVPFGENMYMYLDIPSTFEKSITR